MAQDYYSAQESEFEIIKEICPLSVQCSPAQPLRLHCNDKNAVRTTAALVHGRLSGRPPLVARLQDLQKIVLVFAGGKTQASDEPVGGNRNDVDWDYSCTKGLGSAI